MKSPGQVGYENWRTLILGKEPHWDRLNEPDKARWEQIAEAIVTHYENPQGLGPIARDMTDEELAEFKRRWKAFDPEDFARYQNALDYPE